MRRQRGLLWIKPKKLFKKSSKVKNELGTS